MEDVVATHITLTPEFLKDELAFTEWFKEELKNGSTKGQWVADGKHNFRLTLSDGSYIRLKFFDTIKRIYNSKNVELPGRESYLSYIDVIVMPKGVKGYGFMLDITQHVWGFSRSGAGEKHVLSLAKITTKAANLGIELTGDDWESYYVRQ